MDDLISRQQAINVIERMRAYIGHNMERAVGAAFIEILDDIGEDIGRLPSIQFATDTNVGDKLGTNLAEVGTDLISRQTAIDALYSVDEYNSRSVKAIKQLPPIQPKRGRWVLVCDNNGMHFICNKCGAWRYHQEQKFCGECGADMRGEQYG